MIGKLQRVPMREIWKNEVKNSIYWNCMFSLIILVICYLNCSSTIFVEGNKGMIELSRKSCVKVICNDGVSNGTGFFIAKDKIATCFHVIAEISQEGKNLKSKIHEKIEIIMHNGERLRMSCISIPRENDVSPLFADFAILQVNDQTLNLENYIVKINESELEEDIIGDNCIYSGYPLYVPTMISLKGYISGYSKKYSLLCVQGPINKGNSGGALISDSGLVLGILSMREGEISKGLSDLMSNLNNIEKGTSVRILGVDPLQAHKETIRTLDTYISTGIGNAREIKFLAEYCKNHNIQIGN